MGKKETDDIISVINETQIDVIKLINNTNTEVKQQFLATPDMIEPDFIYGNINPEILRRNISALEEIKTKNEDDSLLIGVLLDDALTKNRFVLANYEFHYGDRKQSEEIHRELNRQLYGLPEKNTFMGILEHFLNMIRQKEKSREQQCLYDELISRLPELPKPGSKLFAPSDELMNDLHEATIEFYEPFLKHIPSKETFTLVEICPICEEILSTEFGGAAQKWKVLFDKERSIACVDQIEREIIFPGKRNEAYYTHQKLTELLIHEVGVHVLRELVFDDVPIEPLRTGLPGYEEIDEGIAKVMAMAVTGRFEYSGLFHYISIGLAVFYGATFREIFEIQKRIMSLMGQGSEGSAYDTARRALRGTGKLPNCKDLVYFNGSNRIWTFISDHITDPCLFDELLLSGKTDIFNSSQERLIYQLKTGKPVI